MKSSEDPRPFLSRQKCPRCKGSAATLEYVNGSPIVRCASKSCVNIWTGKGRYLYHAPKIDTGDKPVNSATVHASISSQKKAAVLERDGYRCVLCGMAAGDGAILHVGHILSVSDGIRFEVETAIINHPDNLMTNCQSCNISIGSRSVAPRLFAHLLHVRNKYVRRALAKLKNDE